MFKYLNISYIHKHCLVGKYLSVSYLLPPHYTHSLGPPMVIQDTNCLMPIQYSSRFLRPCVNPKVKWHLFGWLMHLLVILSKVSCPRYHYWNLTAKKTKSCPQFLSGLTVRVYPSVCLLTCYSSPKTVLVPTSKNAWFSYWGRQQSWW